MQPSRFVTLCFIYSGVLIVAMQVVVFSPDLLVATIGNAGAGLCIFFTGVYRLYSEEGEGKPDEYGLFAYGMASLSVLITLLFLGSLFSF